MIKKILLATMLATSLGTVAIPDSSAQSMRKPPPPARDEAVPQPRRGQAWVPGHWIHQDRRYTWVKGHWVKERRGQHYVHPTWVERNGRWHMERGAWRRGDRDGDGIPNRMDKDRDGDGVRNRSDRAPDNPNRR